MVEGGKQVEGGEVFFCAQAGSGQAGFLHSFGEFLMREQEFDCTHGRFSPLPQQYNQFPPLAMYIILFCLTFNIQSLKHSSFDQLIKH